MRRFKLSPIMVLISSSVLSSQTFAAAQNLTTNDKAAAESQHQQTDVASFDPTFLNVSNPNSIDLTRFNNGASALPGTYQSDIYINSNFVGNAPITFIEQKDKSVQPCLSMEVLKKINFNYSALPKSFTNELGEGKQCIMLRDHIPGAQANYDSGAQRLNISIPQAMMSENARGYVSPELWDRGVPAAMLGYNVNGYTNHSNGRDTQSAYAGINGGVNIGAWYFRHDGTYNWQEYSGGHYQSIDTYAQRDIPAIEGRILLGQSNTSGQVFDTLPFRGVELLSDERMLPQSQRGYAPDIRGIARTNAKVTVRQNGIVIYEKVVSPGAFNIDDLYPTGSGGDLNVTITEADGSSQNFQVPYASVNQLLRPGQQRYNVVVGQLDDTSISHHPELYQATYQRGLSNNITGYGGTQLSQNYYAMQLGSALGTSLGAFAADVTQAHTRLGKSDGTMSGQSYRLSYSKYIQETRSNLTVAAYRFSTSGYLDFHDAMQTLDALHDGQSSDNIWRPKNRVTVTADQSLPENYGQMYVTGYSQNYWNEGHSDLQYQLGYSNSYTTSYNTISYNLSVGRVRNGSGSMETSWLLNFSFPLGRAEQTNAPQLNASLTHDSTGRTGEQVGVSGSAGTDNRYTYGVNGTNYNQGSGSSVSINGQDRTPYSTLSATYSTGKHYQSGSVGMSGTVLGYQGGVVMSPYTGNTFALVEAKGAYGAKVSGYPGITVDPWGHAAVPYLNPYEMNEVSIDPKGLPYNIELENTTLKVAPYSGAVVKLHYGTKHGYPLLITSTLKNGQPLPFGADVFDSQGNSVGAIGQMGQLYARVEKSNDQLMVKWGQSATEQCHMTYQLPSQSTGKNVDALTRFTSTCL
ncbi:fimbria/pilus outer membrane usher protein [Rosenbergiella epipactidis]|uniref:fimbria/pilus outer membrane usher protein n=1 Tax=Rosenbergiella epipactidis TaxID=1544694 RepID=UPI001F4DF0A8|nr:fimbria/pilus outer membrane usher protein [Rosenbergiella epipactidis]